MFANRSCHRPATCKAPAGGHGRDRVRQSSECGSGRLVPMHDLTWPADGGMATSVRESRSWPAEMPASRRAAPDPRQARQWLPNLKVPNRNCAGLSGRPACDAAILRAVARNGRAKRHRTGTDLRRPRCLGNGLGLANQGRYAKPSTIGTRNRPDSDPSPQGRARLAEARRSKLAGTKEETVIQPALAMNFPDSRRDATKRDRAIS